ncbi:MAG: MraY family glycosyltransferase [Bacteroidota bacterium]
MKSVLLLLGTVGFSYMLNKILLRFSKNFGVDSRQAQNIVRWASTSKPTTGGISFYITFLMGSLILMILRPDGILQSDTYLALFLSASLAFMIGFADDAYGTHPGLKFLGQICCGLILIGFGIHINFVATLYPALGFLDYFLTVFWVVGMMNSLNMLDNMDGVTTTIATTICVIAMLMVIATTGIHISNMYYVLIVICGGFMGFLYWNWKPAKVYMGDTGSMFIGLVVAYFGIIYFWNIETSPDNISPIRQILIPVMVFLVPIMDTTFVTVARIARGSSPFVGGKDHLTHNLARIGITEELVPLTLAIVSIVSGTMALYAYKLIPEWQPYYSEMFAIYPIVVFSIFTYFYVKGTRIQKMKELMAERDREKQQTITQEPVMGGLAN